MKTWQKKLPMWLTSSRIFLVIPILIALELKDDWDYWAIAVFLIASLTDFFDGYFARKFNATSNMGKFMDPIADKILVSSVLIMLLKRQVCDPYSVILLLGRDTFIAGIRSIAAVDHIVIAAKSAGKTKTALQMISVPIMILGDRVHPDGPYLGLILLWITVILSLVSGWDYYHDYSKNRAASR